MKKLTFTALICLAGIQACTQHKPLNQMTTELWKEDITYLNKKIQKEFQSFVPGIKDDFRKEVEALKNRLPDLENYEVASEIMRVLSTLQDGHTELNVGNKSVGFHKVPLSLYYFQNEFYILAAHKEYSHLIGGKVVAIEGVSIDQVFGKLKKNMSRDNEMEYLHAGPGYLILTELLAYLDISSSPTQTSFNIELPKGDVVNETLKGLSYDSYNTGTWVTYYEHNSIESPLYISNPASRYWYSRLPESNTMYVNITRLNNKKGGESIKRFTSGLFDQIDQMKPEKLVIDFRLNNGGNYNLSRPIVEAIKSRPWLNKEGKLWAITSRRTFSAASVACIFLKQETNTILVGEIGRTHPNWADNNEYMNLPNSGFLIEYTTKIKAHWPERPDLDHIPVDIEIVPSFEAYSNGSDAVLGYILRQEGLLYNQKKVH